MPNPTFPNPAEKAQTLGSLASREATSAADPDIAQRHGREKREARLRIMAKLNANWGYYKSHPLFAKPGMVNTGVLTDAGGRAVRNAVVELLRSAPLTHGFPPNIVFADTHDVGAALKNCWHLNRGSGLRERTEANLYRYDGPGATPQMRNLSHGGEQSATFQPNTRPFYAALNYSGAKYGGSSHYGKTHYVLKDHMRFNATFLSTDSFVVQTDHGAASAEHLANYHNVYPLIIDVRAGGLDGNGAARPDILKSMIDHALGLKVAPKEEFTGSEYIEAQIPGDIVIARDIAKVVVEQAAYPPGSKVGKNLIKFARKNTLQIEFI